MLNKRLFGIRGAVCAENTPESVVRAVDTLCSRLFTQNALQADDIVSIHFTVTSDITALNPATALRQSSVAGTARRTALFCSTEPSIDGALPRVIRVLLTAYLPETARPKHAYLGGAESLRPDIAGHDGA
ncbi:chorismate mutase [Treponema endosymbiont of Eucomonympha sp.]|uniref:chorismate mutase n=1 Tax=Treponema endosymbiont of Eucomonympha sp. TaxID=1580831 RepID=UPI000750D506|nr:chorismate mutase [Treponema endosymbiont of Eucomonympha sp.]